MALNERIAVDGGTVTLAEGIGFIYDALRTGGTSMPDGGKSVGQSLNDLAVKVNGIHDAIFAGGDSMPDEVRSVGQSLQDITLQLEAIAKRLEANPPKA